jgi:hypothetical protein
MNTEPRCPTGKSIATWRCSSQTERGGASSSPAPIERPGFPAARLIHGTVAYPSRTVTTTPQDLGPALLAMFDDLEEPVSIGAAIGGRDGGLGDGYLSTWRHLVAAPESR